jgi:large subunit ribosomal protein L17
MRHKNRKHKLGASGPHRSAMMGNLSVALITHGRIETTLSKARALRPFIEKVITLAKKAEKSNDTASKLHLRRLAIARVRDKVAVGKLFDERAGEFTERNGGYTRIYKLGQRVGDAAEMALIELIDGNDEGYVKKPKKKTAKKAAKKATKKTEDEGKDESDEVVEEVVDDVTETSENKISETEKPVKEDPDSSEEEVKKSSNEGADNSDKDPSEESKEA